MAPSVAAVEDQPCDNEEVIANSWPDVIDDPPLNCSIGFCEKRLKGEDRHDFCDVECNGRPYKLFAVYDGHGGGAASEHCSIHLLRIIAEEAVKTPSGGASLVDDMRLACTIAFARCHEELRGQSGTTSGTTATVLVVDLQRREVLCCNVGDSAVIVLDPLDTSKLGFASTDHRLHTNKDEQNRVLRMGSRLAYATDPVTKMPAGSLRLWPGGLAVGRSLGDADCGDAVSCEPSVNVVKLPVHGGQLVLCSDGIWDSIHMNAVATVVRSQVSMAKAARKVVDTAIRPRGLRDDITCYVLAMSPNKVSVDGTYGHSDASDTDGTMDRTNAVRRPHGLLPFLRTLVSCCCADSPPPNMDASIKGGQAFEVLYRASSAAPEGDQNMLAEHQQRPSGSSPGGRRSGGSGDDDDSRDSPILRWARGRIGYSAAVTSSVAAAPSPAPAAPAPAAAGPPTPALPLPAGDAPMRHPSTRQGLNVPPHLARRMSESIDHEDVAKDASFTKAKEAGSRSAAVGAGDEGESFTGSGMRPRRASDMDTGIRGLARLALGATPAAAAQVTADPATVPAAGPAAEPVAPTPSAPLALAGPAPGLPVTTATSNEATPIKPPRRLPRLPRLSRESADASTPGKSAGNSPDSSPSASRPNPIPPGRKIHWNEIGEGGFSDMKYLGSGEFCSVFSSTIDGGYPVALKMLRPTKLSSKSAIRDLEFEMHLMSRIHHKHVLRCVGTSIPGVSAERKFIALQTLRSTLHDALPPPPLPDGSSTIQRLSALTRWPHLRSLQLALELAVALRYLHDHCFATYRLLHRDIKPKNLGLMRDGRLVIFDFGVSKLVCRQHELGHQGPEPAVNMTVCIHSRAAARLTRVRALCSAHRCVCARARSPPLVRRVW